MEWALIFGVWIPLIYVSKWDTNIWHSLTPSYICMRAPKIFTLSEMAIKHWKQREPRIITVSFPAIIIMAHSVSVHDTKITWFTMHLYICTKIWTIVWFPYLRCHIRMPFDTYHNGIKTTHKPNSNPPNCRSDSTIWLFQTVFVAPLRTRVEYRDAWITRVDCEIFPSSLIGLSLNGVLNDPLVVNPIQGWL